MAQTYCVAVYDVALAYGGPEEGGWWYDCGSLVRIVKTFKSRDKAAAYRNRLNAKLKSRDFGPNVGMRPKSSVLSAGEYEAQVWEGTAPAGYPDRRPRYE